MDEELLKKAIAIMEKHMDNVEFSTDEFAREMCMSRSNLHIKMKALTGESTNDFIRKMRFNQATKLLKEGRYTVTEISGMVGFNTPSYFATSFKNISAACRQSTESRFSDKSIMQLDRSETGLYLSHFLSYTVITVEMPTCLSLFQTKARTFTMKTERNF